MDLDEIQLISTAFVCSPVPQILDALERNPGARKVHIDKVYDRAPTPAPWGVGPVTLLGDAAHPMQPTLGQGGCMAIEDALELANLLGGAAQASGDAINQGEPGWGYGTWLLRS